jgi:hypothetical protein
MHGNERLTSLKNRSIFFMTFYIDLALIPNTENFQDKWRCAPFA